MVAVLSEVVHDRVQTGIGWTGDPLDVLGQLAARRARRGQVDEVFGREEVWWRVRLPQGLEQAVDWRGGRGGESR